MNYNTYNILMYTVYLHYLYNYNHVLNPMFGTAVIIYVITNYIVPTIFILFIEMER